jgi:hypothetical protein
MTTTAGEKPCSVIDTLTTALAAAAASLFTATPEDRLASSPHGARLG